MSENSANANPRALATRHMDTGCFMMQIAVTRVRIVMIVPLHCCCDENNNNDCKKTYLVK